MSKTTTFTTAAALETSISYRRPRQPATFLETQDDNIKTMSANIERGQHEPSSLLASEVLFPGSPADRNTSTRDSTTITSPSSSPIEVESRLLGDTPSESLANDENDDNAKEDNANWTTERTNSTGNRTVVHGHTLPSGWTCHYNPDTDEYQFELQTEDGRTTSPTKPMQHERAVHVKTPTTDHHAQTSRRPTLYLYECQYGYHFPTSPTSSMISELAKQVQQSSKGPPAPPKTRQVGYGKGKITLPSEEDEQAKRLRDMFPTATAAVVEQMIRIYHGREGLIKAALISLGYKRSTEYNAQQASAQSPIMLMMSKASSKKLLEKLLSYFPDRDENTIKNLMYKHKEVEHEIISALVESSQENRLGRVTREGKPDKIRFDRNGAIMMLRYLKFLYPTCEEIELYHLLHCNDLNVQKVMEEVEKKGHKRANIDEKIQDRNSQLQRMRAQQLAHATKDKQPSSAAELIDTHRKRTKPTIAEARLNSLKDNLRKNVGNLDDGLLIAALHASDYNEALAKKFLEEMEPIDDALYRQRYRVQTETKSDMIAFPCKAIQKGDTNFMSIMSNENVYIPRGVIECENAVALLKVDAATYTEDDFPKVKLTHRQGRQDGMAKGSTFISAPRLQESLLNWRVSLRTGSKYDQVCAIQDRPMPNGRASGRNKSLAHGSAKLSLGHNSELLRREHPFYATKV